jgi:hypothetical protein
MRREEQDPLSLSEISLMDRFPCPAPSLPPSLHRNDLHRPPSPSCQPRGTLPLRSTTRRQTDLPSPSLPPPRHRLFGWVSGRLVPRRTGWSPVAPAPLLSRHRIQHFGRKFRKKYQSRFDLPRNWENMSFQTRISVRLSLKTGSEDNSVIFKRRTENIWPAHQFPTSS